MLRILVLVRRITNIVNLCNKKSKPGETECNEKKGEVSPAFADEQGYFWGGEGGEGEINIHRAEMDFSGKNDRGVFPTY